QGEVLVQAWMGSSDRSVCDRLLQELEVAGALDAWVSPGEGRAGDRSRTVLSVLATADLRESVLRILRGGHPDRILVSAVFSAPPPCEPEAPLPAPFRITGRNFPLPASVCREEAPFFSSQGGDEPGSTSPPGAI